jgi:hypothetical protein
MSTTCCVWDNKDALKTQHKIVGVISALLHFVQALAVFILYFTHFNMNSDGNMPVVQSYTTFAMVNGNRTFIIDMQDAGRWDIRWGVFTFFTCSWVFQLLELRCTDVNNVLRLRYVEYSASASVMIVCIAIETMMLEASTLTYVFLLIFATNMFGLAVHEMLNAGVEWTLCVLIHVAGWVTCLGAYIPIIIYFYTSIGRVTNAGPNWDKAKPIIEGSVWSLFALFMSFGIVQIVDLVQRRKGALQNRPDELFKIIDALKANQKESQQSPAKTVMSAPYTYPSTSLQNRMKIVLVGNPAEPATTIPVSPDSTKDDQTLKPYLQRDAVQLHFYTLGVLYDILSIVAKTLLCWLILTPVFQGVF